MVARFVHALGFFCAVAFLFVGPNVAVAEQLYVAVDGDDSNPGTRDLPWRTLRHACVNLQPGDSLLVEPGEYFEFEDDGIEDNADVILVRSVNVEDDDFEFRPLLGSPNARILIRPRFNDKPPVIHGCFDIRGSYIRIQGLEIVGDPQRSILPGIGVYSSHNISCHYNLIRNHGGGGISFNHSDFINATGNVCSYNATTNPNQSSGISVFQPIVRTESTRLTGVVIQSNVCVGNRNDIPGENGITDGNGIILDDHFYTQVNQVVLDAIDGIPDPNGAGVAVIETLGASEDDDETDEDEDEDEDETDEDENETDEDETEDGGGRAKGDGGARNDEAEVVLLPYARGSFVRFNFCSNNGGRGIHVFLANDAQVRDNIVIQNLQTEDFVEDLPVDEDGVPFFFNGELSSVDSTEVFFLRNLAIAGNTQTVATNEFYFFIDPSSDRGNQWAFNGYLNLMGGNIFSVVGIEETTSRVGRDVRNSPAWLELLLTLL